MIKFRSFPALHKFDSARSSIHNHFDWERHLTTRADIKQNRGSDRAEWRQLAV